MWSLLIANCFKWNVDGFSLGKPDPSVIGGVLRNYNGIFLDIFFLSIEILDSNAAELRTIVKAIELLASKCHLYRKHIIIKSDSANIISWIITLVISLGHIIISSSLFRD